MRYELMLPHQIRQAIEDNVPVVLPLGVLEYHGEHLPVGMDTLAVTRIIDHLEPDLPMVIMPAFYYGAASYAVAGPEGKGSLHVDAETIVPVAKQIFTGLLRIGFRNLHGFIHHQTENFQAGMPTDLAFKLAARQAIFAYVERQRGEGWWGDETLADYYAKQATGSDPFNWIKIHPLLSPEIIAQFPFDHAGIGETSLMMSLCPDTVDMARSVDSDWYTRSAAAASQELGNKGRDLILASLRKILAVEPVTKP
uniref:creatininase family protein n=1 Tax=uncultured Rhizobium sp. TaxID=155567 RepID=UPI00261626E7|nr:creatininase family protein [uncultured Rhizobium sp.]